MKTIKTLFNSRDFRVILENFSSLTILHALNLLLPLIVLPYVLRTLGMSMYGNIVFASSLIAYFIPLTDYSFSLTGTRAIAKNRKSQKNMIAIYNEIMTTKAVMCLFSLLCLIVIVYSVPKFREHALLYWLTFPALIGNVLFPNWFFQGVEQMKFITLINASIRILTSMFVFVFIKVETDYWMYPLFMNGGVILGGFVGQIILCEKFHIKFKPSSLSSVTSTLKDNFPVFVNQAVPTLYNNTTTFLLGLLAPIKSVGIYAAIKKVADLIVLLSSLLMRATFPYFVRVKKYFKQYVNVTLLIFLSVCFFMLVFYKYILFYLGLADENYQLLIAILLAGCYGIVVYDLFGVCHFLANGRDKLVMKVTLYSSLVGFILSYPLVCYLGIWGAAINLSLSRSLMGGWMFIEYKKEYI